MIIPPRFNGPPASANGGYTAGLIAAYLDGPALVTLRRPPPLDTPLDVSTAGDTVLVHGPSGTLIADAEPAEVPDAIVAPVTFAEAVTASQGYLGFHGHPFPTCFVCGPDRAVGDGLRLFPGRLPGGRTATPWTVPDDITPAMVWASLDCPGGWATSLEERPYVLGRLAARVDAVPVPGSACVIMGELIGEEGRKAHVRTTLYSPAADVLARARATWIALV